MKATYKKFTLDFIIPGTTSRGILNQKESWFIIIEKESQVGIGECSIINNLSLDDPALMDSKMKWLCENINEPLEILTNDLIDFPAIKFGLEMAMLALESKDKNILFPSNFTDGKEGIDINGLIWMGSIEFMKDQIDSKLNNGFTCLKLKIGGIDFENEYLLLKQLRQRYHQSDLEIRVDANGAFDMHDSLNILSRLSELKIHSIEQPIRQGQIDNMAFLCKNTPIPIALDEELIGINNLADKREIINLIKPQYIILKPSLLGGFKSCNEWINVGISSDTEFWITSALESNLGLSAIAQWTFTLNNSLPQGLGTGTLFSNNFTSPLFIKNGKLHYNKINNWNLNF